MPTFKDLYPQFYTDEYQANGPEVPADPNPDVSPISQYSAFATMGRPNPRDMSMSQVSGEGQLPRYAELRPPASSLAQKLIGFTGGNYARDYAFQQQRFDAAQERREQNKAQQAALDAQTELLLFDKIQKADPGERQPYTKALSRWYKAKGVDVDKGFMDVWNNAEADELEIYRQAGQEFLKQQAIENNWTEDELQEKTKRMLASPVAFARIHAEALKLQKLREETKKLKAESEEIAGFTKAVQETTPGVSTGSPLNSQPSAIPRPAPQPVPEGSQGPKMGTPMLRPTGTGDQPNLPTRNNNPTNIKVGPATVKWIKAGIAEPGDPAQDGGRFLKFRSPEDGFKAADDLLRNPFYADKNLEEAMRAWSGGGYGAEVAKGLSPEKRIGQLQPAERQHLVQSMAQREGFGGMSRPSTPAAAGGANEAELQALQEYKVKIDDLQMRIDKLSPYTRREGAKRYVDELRATQKTLMEQRDRIEKKYETAPTTPEGKAAVRIFRQPFASLDPQQQQIAAEEAPKLEAQDAALKAKSTAEATKDIDIEKQRAGREGQTIKDVNDYVDKEGNPPPVGWTMDDLKKAGGYRQVKQMSEKQFEDVQARRDLLVNFNDLARNHKAITTGPVEGRLERWGQALGAKVKDDTVAQRLVLNKIKNDVAFLRGGKNLTVNEAKRIEAELPSDTDPPAVFQTKLTKALSIAKRVQEDRLKDLKQSGFKVSTSLEDIGENREAGPVSVETPKEKSKVEQLIDLWKK